MHPIAALRVIFSSGGNIKEEDNDRCSRRTRGAALSFSTPFIGVVQWKKIVVYALFQRRLHFTENNLYSPFFVISNQVLHGTDYSL